jgi:hypothetical protein
MANPPKYSTEAGIWMSLGKLQLCQQVDFPHFKTDPNIRLFTHYLICQRNRIEVQPETLSATNETISAMFTVHDKHDKFEVPGKMPNKMNTENVKFEHEFPFNYFIVVNEEDQAGLVKASAVLDFDRGNIPRSPSFLDLEVLYIG